MQQCIFMSSAFSSILVVCRITMHRAMKNIQKINCQKARTRRNSFFFYFLLNWVVFDLLSNLRWLFNSLRNLFASVGFNLNRDFTRTATFSETCLIFFEPNDNVRSDENIRKFFSRANFSIPPGKVNFSSSAHVYFGFSKNKILVNEKKLGIDWPTFIKTNNALFEIYTTSPINQIRNKSSQGLTAIQKKKKSLSFTFALILWHR